ncbi:MAG: hypothetical protein ACK5HT_15920, partial [Draconibacterium sp.]
FFLLLAFVPVIRFHCADVVGCALLKDTQCPAFWFFAACYLGYDGCKVQAKEDWIFQSFNLISPSMPL